MEINSGPSLPAPSVGNGKNYITVGWAKYKLNLWREFKIERVIIKGSVAKIFFFTVKAMRLKCRCPSVSSKDKAMFFVSSADTIFCNCFLSYKFNFYSLRHTGSPPVNCKHEYHLR